jgi:hypothetical protein
MMNMYKSNLLTVGQKAEIAEALHAAVCYTTRTEAHRHCAYFAFAGVGLLKELCSDGEQYKPVWGRFRAKRATNTLVENFVWEHDHNLIYDKYKFIDYGIYTDHCFIVGGEEILDFSTRTHGAYWQRRFQVRDWEFSPPFFWGTIHQVPQRYQPWFDHDGVLDPNKFLEGEYHAQVVADIVLEALWRLDESGFSTGTIWGKPRPRWGL